MLLLVGSEDVISAFNASLIDVRALVLVKGHLILWAFIFTLFTTTLDYCLFTHLNVSLQKCLFDFSLTKLACNICHSLITDFHMLIRIDNMNFFLAALTLYHSKLTFIIMKLQPNVRHHRFTAMLQVQA